MADEQLCEGKLRSPSQEYNLSKLPLPLRRPAVKLLACALLAVVVPSSAIAQGTPIPPGIRQADRAEEQAQRDMPPPTPPHAHVDLIKLRQDADDLARLAQTIPADVASVQRGILPKEMLDKLKQIEKLSKNIRSSLKP
jgi:hypothetical protein